MGTRHLLNSMNKNSETRYLAYSHTHRILTQFNHWPTEALESNPLKLPTLRVLRLASTITNIHLENLPTLTCDNAFATSIRMASQDTDDTRHKKRHTTQGTTGTKEYDTLVRQQWKPIQYSNKLLNTSPHYGKQGSKTGTLYSPKYTPPQVQPHTASSQLPPH